MILFYLNSGYVGGAELCAFDVLREFDELGIDYLFAAPKNVMAAALLAPSINPKCLLPDVMPESPDATSFQKIHCWSREAMFILRCRLRYRITQVFYVAPGAHRGFGVRLGTQLACLPLLVNYQLFPCVVRYGVAKRLILMGSGLCGETAVAVSIQNLSCIRRSIGRWIKKLYLLPNLPSKAAEPVERTPVDPRYQSFRNAYRWIVIGAGSCDRRKGIDRFLAVAAEELDRGETGFVWLGGGADLEAWRRRAPGNCLLLGHAPHPLDEMNRSDVFLFLSRGEGFARVLAEAACLGLPIVATPVGGLAEIVAAEATVLTINEASEEGIIRDAALALRSALPSCGNRDGRRARWLRYDKRSAETRHNFFAQMKSELAEAVI
jgi:glycosyltransferase involved in cell wall biosynthesis